MADQDLDAIDDAAIDWIEGFLGDRDLAGDVVSRLRSRGLLATFDPWTRKDDGSLSPPQEFAYARSLLGEEVEVVLEKGLPDGTDATVAKGTLLAIEDTGQVVLRDEMGFGHYCWPMLTIRKAQP
jgi:hypothetical protein